MGCRATVVDVEQWSWQCIEAIPNDILQHVMALCQVRCKSANVVMGLTKKKSSSNALLVNFLLSQEYVYMLLL
jgi:hypothetical protein